MPTYCNEKEIQYVNRETGEIITSTTEKTFSYKVKNNDEFIMLYYKYVIPATTGMKSFKAFCLLLRLVDIANYNTGSVDISIKTRENLCKTLDISAKNFNKYINELKNANMISGSRGLYTINPKYFWKGDSNERNKMLKDKLFYVKFGFTDKPKEQ